MRATLACLMTCVACESVQVPPKGFHGGLKLESESFFYYARATDHSVCSDTITVLEDHFAALTPSLGLTTKPSRKIDYFKFLDVDDSTRASPCGTWACTLGLTIFSPILAHGHQLNHAYLAPVGDPPWLFAEGLTEVLACRYRRWTPDERARLEALRWDWLAAWHRVAEWEFAGAAQLTRFLIDRFGMESVVQFYATAPFSRAIDVVTASFAEHFGIALADAWQEALKLAHPDGICLTPHQCGAPPIALDGTPVTFAERCGIDEEFRTFTLTESAAISVVPGGDGDFLLRSCDGLQAAPGWNAVSWSSYQNATLLTRLPAGRYFLHHRRIPTLNGIGTAAARAHPRAWIATDCAAATADPFPVDVSKERLAIEVPDGAPVTYVGVSFAQPTTVFVVAPSTVPGPAFLCDRCGQDTKDCSVRLDVGATATLQGNYVFVVPTDPLPGTFRSVLIDPAAP